eukprot:TRINITY_DN5856_c0_g1_i6.p1 TRINITY_DN5856_c0_g1~~TRINITY_DN5856_c0_g1_i6.p1  ORF type:complete len:127 (+),score=19.01 TRINITY_DN5856_c0_g1_i6:92-472(+)
MALLARSQACATGVDFSNVNIADSDMRGMVLSESSVKGSCFRNCWVEQCVFSNVDFQDSNWTGSLRPPMHCQDSVDCVVLSADGKKIVSGSGDGTIRVWDLETGKETLKLEGHTSDVYSVAMSGDR